MQKAVVITDDDEVYRRCFPKGTPRRVTLAAYVKRDTGEADPEISVDLARMTTPEATRDAGPPGCRIGVLTVGQVRALGFTVEYRPIPGDTAHCVILGATSDDDCDRLAELTTLHDLPPRHS